MTFRSRPLHRRERRPRPGGGALASCAALRARNGGRMVSIANRRIRASAAPVEARRLRRRCGRGRGRPGRRRPLRRRPAGRPPARVDDRARRRRACAHPDHVGRARGPGAGRLVLGLRRARRPRRRRRRPPHRASAPPRSRSASAAVPGPPIDLVAVPAVRGGWSSECLEDPFAVPLAEKGDLLTGGDRDDAGGRRGRRRGARRRRGTPAPRSSPARARGSASTCASAAPACTA